MTTFDPALKKRLRAAVDVRTAGLMELYRHFHANPELSGQEKETAAKTASELKAIGLEVITGIGGHGLVGILDNGPGPILLIRADMDALPLTEAADLPYASKVRTKNADGREIGVMHACGHDLHTTCLIGAASVLTEMKDTFSGKVLFVAQPAEEAIGGAQLMMEDGFYNTTGRPDRGLALHVRTKLASGRVGLGPGAISTGSNSLDVIIKGYGGHGAAPHLAKDPVVLAAQFILAVQTIISREIDPAKTGLITIGAIHGGTKRNIIPEEVVLNLTARAYDARVGAQLVEAIERIARGLAETAGLPPDRHPLIKVAETPYPPLVNDAVLTDRLQKRFADLLGPDKVEVTPPGTGSEDFGIFGLTDPPIPLVMYHLGVTDQIRLEQAEKGQIKLAHEHEPGFRIDLEKSLPTGVLTMAGAALDLLDEN